MSLRLVIGASGAGKSTRIYREVIERSQKDPGGKFFIIVPDQFSMQTQMDLVSMHEKKGIMNIDVLSFGRLRYRIFEEVGGAEHPMLDDTGKSLIIRKVAGSLKEQMPLIGGNLSRTGYVHEVKSAISEFMQYGIGLEQLQKLKEFSKKRGQLYQKLADLQVIYQGFLSFIEQRFLTREESLSILAQRLPESALVRDAVFVFDGFTGFTPVQLSVIRQLLLLAREVVVTVTIDGREDPYRPGGEQELFYLSRKTVQSLLKLEEETKAGRGEDICLAPKTLPRFIKSPALAHLERQLFRYPAQPFLSEKEENGAEMSGISLMEASTVSEELRQVCIALRRMIRERDYCYRDFAVICGDFGAYAGCAERIFAEYDIPIYMDQTKGIVHNPFIEYLKSALQIRVSSYSFEAVFHYLRSGLSGFTQKEADRLENYVRALGIRGRRKWETAFVHQTKDMEDGPEELAFLNELRQRLVEQLAPLFTESRYTSEFARGLYQFIVDNQVQQQLEKMEEGFLQAGDMVRAREYAQIYRLVMELLDQIVELIGEEEAKPEEFARILDAGFDEITVGTIPQNVDRVVVGDMERTRLKPVKVLFFVGVNDGYIPKAATKGGLISDLDREFLLASGQELAPAPRQQMYIQKLYLYLNMTKPSEELVISYARMDVSGKALRPSFLIDQVRRLFPGLQLRQPEKMPVLEQIQTWKDGRRFFARGLREYAEGVLQEKDREQFLMLYHLYGKNDVYRLWSGQLTDTAFFSYQGASLGKAVAAALYGQTLLSSVSRLEQYAACAYAHFLKYGLGLQEQGEFALEAVDLGNIFHGVLEIFAQKLQENNYTWFDFPKEEGERLVEEAVDAYSVTYNHAVLFDSARSTYMIRRIKRILKRTVLTMQYQLKQGSFVPEQFEVSFAVAQDLQAVNIALSGEEKMRLKGRIDRMDICEKEDKVYVKVVDYKSGAKDFSLAALYYGLQLQLVVYLNAAMEITANKHPGKEVVPAAMLYYRVQDPMISLEGKEPKEEALQEQILKALRTTGVVNEAAEAVENLDHSFVGRSDVIPVERKQDGSYSARSATLGLADFQAISQYVTKKIRQTGRQILDGEIGLNPYTQGDKSACDWCSYQKVCGFDPKVKGYALRELEDLKEEEALLRIRREAADGSEIHS